MRFPGKRLNERFVIHHEAQLMCVDGDQGGDATIDIVLHDISRDGARFYCERDLIPRSTWRVCFLNDGYVVTQQPSIIRHCRKVGPEIHLVGAQFHIETGLLCLLGVAPADVFAGDWPSANDAAPGVSLPPAKLRKSRGSLHTHFRPLFACLV